MPNQHKGSHRTNSTKAHSKGNGAVRSRTDGRGGADVAGEATGSGWDSAHLTSGDIARMLHVDLKTIHNWVTQGHISGARTKGRHLRFARSEVVRFMRKYGYAIPQAVGASPARVMVLRDIKGPWLGVLRRSAQVLESPDLFAAALMLATEPCEVVIVSLDSETPRVHDFVRAVKGWEPTSAVVLIGLGTKPAARKAFLAAGGNLALAPSSVSEIRSTVQYVVGASLVEPSSVETLEH